MLIANVKNYQQSSLKKKIHHTLDCIFNDFCILAWNLNIFFCSQKKKKNIIFDTQ